MATRDIFRNTVWQTVDLLLDLTSTVVISVAVARVIGPERLGYYSSAVWAATFTAHLAMFGVPAATRKFAAEFLGAGKRTQAMAVVRAALRFQFFTATVVVTTAIAAILAFAAPGHKDYTLLVMLGVFAHMLMAIPTSFNVASEDFRSNAWPSICSTLLRLVGTVAVLVPGGPLVGLAAVLLLSQVLDAGLRFYRFWRTVGTEVAAAPAHLSPDVRARLVRFCWKSSILLVLNLIVWERSEMFFLNRFSSIKEVAFYSLSFGIVHNLQLLPIAFGSVAGATILVRQGQDRESQSALTASAVRYMALLAFPLALGLAALSDPLLRLLYGSRYLPVIPVLALTALFSLTGMLLIPASQMAIANEEQSFLIRWGSATAVATLFLDYWWIPGAGAVGAAWANGMGGLIASSGIWVYVIRRYSIPMRWSTLAGTASAALGMGVVVYAIAGQLPPLGAVLCGIPAGVLLYAFLLRWTRNLDSEDRDRLLQIERQLPAWIRRPYAQGVRFICPDPQGY